MLNGMSKENGGTLIVPGSHLFGRHPDNILDKDIFTISAEGPPGCAIITDGRLWHGTGANITQKNRLALLITFCGPQFRPQENFTMGIREEVFLQLNDYQKEILGFKVWNGYGRTGNPTEKFLNINNIEVGELKI
jgi:ectoine hydroxylase-related dioxygenase (phytanoyl-CoA dioxygenase family)